jgi:hypothetical protein
VWSAAGRCWAFSALLFILLPLAASPPDCPPPIFVISGVLSGVSCFAFISSNKRTGGLADAWTCPGFKQPSVFCAYDRIKHIQTSSPFCLGRKLKISYGHDHDVGDGIVDWDDEWYARVEVANNSAGKYTSKMLDHQPDNYSLEPRVGSESKIWGFFVCAKRS